MDLTLSISKRNTKLGAIHNISLPPSVSCPEDAPCREACYAQKSWRMYANVRAAWAKNWDVYQHDPMEYFAQISEYIRDHVVQVFRWHVAGDIPNMGYYIGMCLVAKEHPDTRFLCFTKQVSVTTKPRPDNLRVLFSMWPNMNVAKNWEDRDRWLAIIKKHCPIAWFDPKEQSTDDWYNRALADVGAEGAVPCHKKCEDCGMCWHLEPGMSVILKEH